LLITVLKTSLQISFIFSQFSQTILVQANLHATMREHLGQLCAVMKSSREQYATKFAEMQA